MKTLATITLDNVNADYTRLLADSGCEVRAAENTGSSPATSTSISTCSPCSSRTTPSGSSASTPR